MFGVKRNLPKNLKLYHEEEGTNLAILGSCLANRNILFGSHGVFKNLNPCQHLKTKRFHIKG